MYNKNITVQLKDKANKVFSFNDIDLFLEFLKKEAVYWNEVHQTVTKKQTEVPHTHTVGAKFEQASINIENWLNSNKKADEGDIQIYLNAKILPVFNNIHKIWLSSEHPFTENYVVVSEHSSVSAEQFLRIIVNHQVGNITKYEEYEGTFAAFLYLLRNQDEITFRYDSEIKSFEALRDKANEIIKNQKTDYNALHNELSNEASKKISELEELIDTVTTNSNNTINRLTENHDAIISDAKEKIDALENLYEEKLRLSKPAEYWENQCQTYKKSARWFLSILMIFLVAGVFGLGGLLYKWVTIKEIKINFHTLQGVTIIITIISIYAYLIKVLSRLTFSSFHLQRDAKEREQLIYLYLSLNEGKDEQEESRHIVLQSLFSRVDTGLLWKESGPTMPNNLSDFISRAVK